MIVCKKCHSVYPASFIATLLNEHPEFTTEELCDVIDDHGNKTERALAVPLCPFIAYPKAAEKKYCSEPLITMRGGQRPHGRDSKTVLYKPIRLCYVFPLQEFLRVFVANRDYSTLVFQLREACQRKIADPSDKTRRLRDVWDGALWANFQSDWEKDPGSLFVALGVSFDFISLFLKAARSSAQTKKLKTGQLSCIVMNLPLKERWASQNIGNLLFLEGEPPGNINGYIRPLVEQLKVRFCFLKFHLTPQMLGRDGIKLRTQDKREVNIRVRLFQVSADSPATT